MPYLRQIANENPDQYRAMSVQDRLAMLQNQLGEQGGDFEAPDMQLLQLLRARREREMASNAAPPPVAPPGLLQRLFGSLQQMNPFDQVAQQLQ